MKKSILAMGISILAWPGTGAMAADITLRYSSWTPPAYHLNVNVLEPWFDEIEKVTEGRVKVETLPKVVGTPASQYEVVQDGLADISFIVGGYTPGRFPVLEMAEISFYGNDARAIGPVLDKFYREKMQSVGEFEGVEVLAAFNNGGGGVLTVTSAIDDVADFQGKKIRSTGPYATELLTALGAVPILKPSVEAFELLSTKVIDGGVADPSTLIGMNMLDYVEHYLVIPGGFSGASLAVIINSDSWNQISEEDRKAIGEITFGPLAEKAGQSYYEADQASLQAIRDKGVEIIVADEEMLSELRVVVEDLENAWAERAKAKGLENPLEILEDYRAEVAEVEAELSKSN